MVQGHAFYLTLASADRSAFWYRVAFLHTRLYRTGFMFEPVLAFGFTTLSDRIDQHARWTPRLRHRLYRYLSLIVIGYALQLPPLAENAVHWLQSDSTSSRALKRCRTSARRSCFANSGDLAAQADTGGRQHIGSGCGDRTVRPAVSRIAATNWVLCRWRAT